jgi:hypothetical protein
VANNTFIFLTHSQLVNVFKGGYCYSLSDRVKFDQGVDEYIVPSVIKDLQFRVPGTGVKSQNARALEDIKNDFATYVKKEFWDYFNGQTSFDVFHDKVCNDMIKIFSERYNNVAYGKGQKAANMAFKYFYCFADADLPQYEIKFADCHMPLDSKILEWYRQNVDVTQHTAWSYLDKAEYDAIKDNIKKHIDSQYGGGYTVLQSEFIIWDDAINNKTTTP